MLTSIYVPIHSLSKSLGNVFTSVSSYTSNTSPEIIFVSVSTSLRTLSQPEENFHGLLEPFFPTLLYLHPYTLPSLYYYQTPICAFFDDPSFTVERSENGIIALIHIYRVCFQSCGSKSEGWNEWSCWRRKHTFNSMSPLKSIISILIWAKWEGWLGFEISKFIKGQWTITLTQKLEMKGLPSTLS